MEATKSNDQCLRTDGVNDQYLRTGVWRIKWIRAKWPYLLPRVDWDVMMGDVDWTSWHHIGSINVEPVWSDPKRRARGARIEDMYYDWRVPNLDHSKLRSSREDFQAHYQDAKEEMSHDDPKTRGRRVGSTLWVDALHCANEEARKLHTSIEIMHWSRYAFEIQIEDAWNTFGRWTNTHILW